jgi:hypothetical protein
VFDLDIGHIRAHQENVRDVSSREACLPGIFFSSNHGFSFPDRKKTTQRIKTSFADITSGETRNF